MKNLMAITMIVSGLLLLLIPRYILPACEYEGFSAMRCSDTPRAEYLAGAFLMVLGRPSFLLASIRALPISASAGPAGFCRRVCAPGQIRLLPQFEDAL